MADARDDLAEISAVAGLSEVLLAALEHTRSATCITTAQLDPPGPEIVYVNPAYCAMTGRARRDVIGATPRVMQGPLTDRRVLDRLRSDLAAGRRFTGETVNYRADGTPFIINWSIDAVLDDRGNTTHFVATQQDVTEAVRTRALLAAGRRLDDALASMLDASIRASDALQFVADAIAAGASSIAGMGEVSVALANEEDRTELVSGASILPVELLDERFDIAPSRSPVRGHISVRALSDAERMFLDVEGLARYADRAGVVCAALLEYLQQRNTAVRLQRSMLPPAELQAPRFSIATFYQPGALGLEVGGDWYDVAPGPDRSVFSVGDVSGSGVGAAMLMGRLRLLAEIELKRGVEVPEVLTLLDAECRGAGQMATVAMIEAGASTGMTSVWVAGHLPPLILAAGGSRLVEVEAAPPLGFMREPPTPSTVELRLGDGMLLYTDGLVERRTEIVDRGLERLVAALEPGAAVDALIAQAVEGCSASGADDIALLAFRRSTE